VKPENTAIKPLAQLHPNVRHVPPDTTARVGALNWLVRLGNIANTPPAVLQLNVRHAQQDTTALVQRVLATLVQPENTVTKPSIRPNRPARIAQVANTMTKKRKHRARSAMNARQENTHLQAAVLVQTVQQGNMAMKSA
jgi:hypothetical protein